jgi:disulfide bond formation protein DsbB
LVACAHNPSVTGRRFYAGTGILFSLAGLGVAGRHVWIQNLPEDQVPACGPGLEYMFETFPLTQALELLFMGDGNCADVVWTFLGLSIPGWMLVFFCGFIGANFWQLLRRS